MAEETVLVRWYDHDCPWVTKYCDENHTKTAQVPVSVLKEYETVRPKQ